MNCTKRSLIVGAAVLGAGLVSGALYYAARVAGIAVAYKAKTVCSAVFVSRRNLQAAVADLEVDDLAILRHVGLSIDLNRRAVTATAAGIITRRATYREGLGCALELDGLTPPGSPADEAVRSPDVDPMRRLPPWADTLARTDDGRRGELEGVIASAFAEPKPLRPRRTQAVVIVHKGHIVAERYAAGIRSDTPLVGWSMTKSVMNALVGILVREGRLKLDRPAPIPEWQAPGDPRASITLDHLLRMSSGLRFDEDMSSPLADVNRMLLGVGDVARFATSTTLAATPGTKWQYSSGTSNIIARIIRNALADDAAYLAFPRRALFDRTGMASAVLETDAAGTFVGSSFMYATARDWARFGMLYLQDGTCGGQRILPKDWVAYTRMPAPADPRKHYGAGFWLDVPDEYRRPGSLLPGDAFHAAGHEAQFVTIVPSHDAVIVRLGHTRYADAWDQAAFVRDVLEVLEGVRR